MSRHTVTFAGHRLAYRLRGNGPPVLWVQGVGLHGDGWTPQTDPLSDAFTCLSFDNRGLGGSEWDRRPLTVEQMAADAAAIMDAQGWGSAHVVGHSLGGLIALRLALEHRVRVCSLSLLCTFASGRAAAPLTPRMLALGLRSQVGTRRMRRRAFLQMVMSPAGLAEADADALARRLEPIFGHDLGVQPKVVAAQLKAMRRFDATPRLAELAQMPTLVASAIYDPIAPTKAGRALAAAIPGARYVEWGDASHGAPIERAAHVNRLLRDHILAAEVKRHGEPVAGTM